MKKIALSFAAAVVAATALAREPEDTMSFNGFSVHSPPSEWVVLFRNEYGVLFGLSDPELEQRRAEAGFLEGQANRHSLLLYAKIEIVKKAKMRKLIATDPKKAFEETLNRQRDVTINSRNIALVGFNDTNCVRYEWNGKEPQALGWISCGLHTATRAAIHDPTRPS